MGVQKNRLMLSVIADVVVVVLRAASLLWFFALLVQVSRAMAGPQKNEMPSWSLCADALRMSARQRLAPGYTIGNCRSSQDLTHGTTDISPEHLAGLNILVVREGLLPGEMKQTLPVLPDDADKIPVLSVKSSGVRLSEDEAFARLDECVPDSAGKGINGRVVTIFLEELVEGLAQGRSMDDFFNESQRECLIDVSNQGYYLTFRQFEPVALL